MASGALWRCEKGRKFPMCHEGIRVEGKCKIFAETCSCYGCHRKSNCFEHTHAQNEKKCEKWKSLSLGAVRDQIERQIGSRNCSSGIWAIAVQSFSAFLSLVAFRTQSVLLPSCFVFKRLQLSEYIAFHKSIIPEATVQSIPKLFEMKLEICGNLCNRECILFRFEFFTLIFVVEAINNNNKLTDWLMETKFGAGVVVLDVFQLLPSIHLHVIIFFSLLCCVFNYVWLVSLVFAVVKLCKLESTLNKNKKTAHHKMNLWRIIRWFLTR